MRVSRAAYRKLTGKNPHKYGARKTVYDGETYDSAAEANVAAILDLKKKAGKIVGWHRAPNVTLVPGPTRTNRIVYRPDFMVETAPLQTEALDVKGMILPVFKLKAILWSRAFPGIPLKVVDRDGNEIWRLK